MSQPPLDLDLLLPPPGRFARAILASSDWIERAAVEGHHRRGLVIAVIWMFATLYASAYAPNPWAVGILAVLAAVGSMCSLRRALAYKNGWLRGRRELREALTGALQAGTTIQEWLLTEMDRDFNVALGSGDRVKDD